MRLLDLKVCEQCQKPYLPTRYWQKYCGNVCRNLAFYKRQASRDPLDILLHSPQKDTTSLQQAEYERRQALALEKAKTPKPQEPLDPRTAEIVRQAEKLIPEPGLSLEDLFGDKKEKDQT